MSRLGGLFAHFKGFFLYMHLKSEVVTIVTFICTATFTTDAKMAQIARSGKKCCREKSSDMCPVIVTTESVLIMGCCYFHTPLPSAFSS